MVDRWQGDEQEAVYPEQIIGILLCSDAVQPGDETIWQNCGLLSSIANF